MKIKPIFRVDPTARIVRLFSAVHTVGRVGDGNGYSSKTTLGLVPRLFSLRREWSAWTVTLLGIRLHHHRSYGGIFC